MVPAACAPSAGFFGLHVEGDILAEWLVGQRSIYNARYEMWFVWILTAADIADLLHQVAQPAEIVAGLVVIIRRRLASMDQADPRRVPRSLEMLRMVGIDLHDPIDIRNRYPDFTARHKDIEPALQDRNDFLVAEMLHDKSGIDLAGRIAREALEKTDVVYDINAQRVHQIDIDIARQTDVPASEMQTVGLLKVVGRLPLGARENGQSTGPHRMQEVVNENPLLLCRDCFYQFSHDLPPLNYEKQSFRKNVTTATVVLRVDHLGGRVCDQTILRRAVRNERVFDELQF